MSTHLIEGCSELGIDGRSITQVYLAPERLPVYADLQPLRPIRVQELDVVLRSKGSRCCRVLVFLIINGYDSK